MKTTNELTPQSTFRTDLTIEGITEPVVLRYFETMNAGDYEATAALFADVGAMHPPFEEPIEGKVAILDLPTSRSRRNAAVSSNGVVETLLNDQTQIQVTGKVQTPWFGVNVSWIFSLSSKREILTAKIKLLASPEELLSLRR